MAGQCSRRPATKWSVAHVGCTYLSMFLWQWGGCNMAIACADMWVAVGCLRKAVTMLSERAWRGA